MIKLLTVCFIAMTPGLASQISAQQEQYKRFLCRESKDTQSAGSDFAKALIADQRCRSLIFGGNRDVSADLTYANLANEQPLMVQGTTGSIVSTRQYDPFDVVFRSFRVGAVSRGRSRASRPFAPTGRNAGRSALAISQARY